MPSSFTLTQTSTGNAWTTNVSTGQIRDGNWGGDPVLTMVPSQPSDIYATKNPGIWYRLAGSGNYVRHSGYVMWTQGYGSGSFDFAWAFFLQNGTNNQVKIWNPYPGDGVGYWVQSGLYNAGRIAISTQNPALANVYTISTPIPLTQLSGKSLFSQLSTSAVASAMGAFALRAVNGVTARAVQIRRSTDNATQDFWADRLGNLLTAPVTGQTMASWLGGASGYVSIWYDQSGNGSHMSCSSTSIQPLIDLTNKWIDFKTSAWFDTSATPTTGPVPYSNTKNYTVTCRHNTIGTNDGGICGVSNGAPNYNSSNYTNNFRRNTTNYQNYWFYNDANGGTYGVGNSVTFKWDGTNRYIYSNGTLVTTVPSSNWLETSSSNQMIAKTTAASTMNGEMYYLFTFNSALSDADRQLIEALPIS